jgi:rhodanese-related sulfurtransferase
MKKTALLLSFCLLFLAANICAQTSVKSNIISLNKTEFKTKLAKKGVQLVDVRTPAEFILGHIDSALNLNVNDVLFKEQVAKLNKNKPVALYCKAGSRSARAANILSEMGFKTIYNLDGGYMAWTSN